MYRVGIIGRTGRGNYGHGLDVVWQQFPQTQIVAVADDDSAGLTKAGERLGVRARYSDYVHMLRQERPDLVAICPRWPDCHEEMVIAAAEHHASIYLEKPMARTPAEADRMIDACDRSHVKLAVAHQMRIAPILDLAKKWIAQGAIGELEEMRGRGKEDQRAGGEDLMVLGTHVMDLMRQFAGDPLWAFGKITAGGRDIRRSDARQGPEGLGLIAGDTVNGMYAFRNGLTGYFGSARNEDRAGQRFGLDLYGSKGILAIRAGMEPEVQICESRKWTGAFTQLCLPGNPPPRDTNGANAALVADLLEAITQDRPPKSGGLEARWTIEMVMALYESQLSGTRVPFPLRRRAHPLA